MSIIAFDSHKHYTFARVEGKKGENPKEFRIEHERGNIVEFLSRQQPGSSVAVETVGNWYWIIDEIEQSGMRRRKNVWPASFERRRGERHTLSVSILSSLSSVRLKRFAAFAGFCCVVLRM